MQIIFDQISMNSRAGGVMQSCQQLISGFRGINSPVVLASESLLWATPERVARLGRFVSENLSSLEAPPNTQAIFPNYYLPHLASRVLQRNSIVVIHDLQYLSLPQYFSKLKRTWLESSYRRAHEKSGALVFISNASRIDYLHRFGDRPNTYVIPNAVRLPEPSTPVESGREIDPPYFLTSSHFYPHKNFEGVLRFFYSLVRQGSDAHLVLTGHGNDQVRELIKSNIPPSAQSRIRFLGFVEQKRLRSLQRSALAVISLSRFEGFNLPAAEATVDGIPLILSDISVHRELYPHSYFLDKSEECELGSLMEELERQRMQLNQSIREQFRSFVDPGNIARKFHLVLDEIAQ